MLKKRLNPNVAAAIAIVALLGILITGYKQFLQDPPQVSPEETLRMMTAAGQQGQSGQGQGGNSLSPKSPAQGENGQTPKSPAQKK